MLSCLETLVGHVIVLKGLIAAAFKSSELLYLLRLNGHVGAISTYKIIPSCDNGKLHYKGMLIVLVALGSD